MFIVDMLNLLEPLDGLFIHTRMLLNRLYHCAIASKFSSFYYQFREAIVDLKFI